MTSLQEHGLSAIIQNFAQWGVDSCKKIEEQPQIGKGLQLPGKLYFEAQLNHLEIKMGTNHCITHRENKMNVPSSDHALAAKTRYCNTDKAT